MGFPPFASMVGVFNGPGEVAAVGGYVNIGPSLENILRI